MALSTGWSQQNKAKYMANRKYIDNHTEALAIRLPLGLKDKLKKEAARLNVSMRQYIILGFEYLLEARPFDLSESDNQ